ncbi:hypothetical protein M662_03280 [Bacillus sp. SB49]|uniref:hypothetical protein n=1 Tax=Bacillus sp. SB49 TaxID=1071080 RepID=UPI0004213D36|nr:hypothetical protein [Bacillus sp. SB49]QHT45575.1 hypothetical protein M662_03280 [Bacillus sp. SB49]
MKSNFDFKFDPNHILDQLKSICSNYPNLISSLEDFQDRLDRGLKDDEQKYKQLMLVAGFPPISTISMNEVIDIVELTDKYGAEEVLGKLKKYWWKDITKVN